MISPAADFRRRHCRQVFLPLFATPPATFDVCRQRRSRHFRHNIEHQTNTRDAACLPLDFLYFAGFARYALIRAAMQALRCRRLIAIIDAAAA